MNHQDNLRMIMEMSSTGSQFSNSSSSYLSTTQQSLSTQPTMSSIMVSHLMNLERNATNCSKDFPTLEAPWLYSMALITFIGFVITITSNGIIFYLFWSTPSLRNNPSNIIAFNLSLSDLLLSTQWPSVIYCCLTQSKGILRYEWVTGFASILTVLAMSVERAVVIRSSLLAKSRITIRVACITTLLIWAGALVANLPPILQMVARYRIDPSNTGCFLDYLTLDEHRRSTNAYIFILTLCFFILPAIIIFISYMVILNAFKKSSNRLQRIDCELQSSVNSSSGRKSAKNNNCGDDLIDEIEALGEPLEQLESGSRRQLARELKCNSPGERSTTSVPTRSHFASLGDSLRMKMSYRMRQQQRRRLEQNQKNVALEEHIYFDGNRRLSDGVIVGQASCGQPTMFAMKVQNRCNKMDVDTRPTDEDSPRLIGQSISAPTSSYGNSDIEQRGSAFNGTPTPEPISRGIATGDPICCSRLEAINRNLALTLKSIPNRNGSHSLVDSIEIATRKYSAADVSLEARKFSYLAEETGASRAFDDEGLDLEVLRPVYSKSASPRLDPVGLSPFYTPMLAYRARANQIELNQTRRDNSTMKQSFSATFVRTSNSAVRNDSLRGQMNINTISGASSNSNNMHNSSIIKQNQIHQTYSRTDLQIRLAIMSFYLILLWLISWAPIALLSMINSLDSRCEKFSSLAIFLASTMTKVGPTFDVFIYGISHPKIKVRYRQIIKRLVLAGPYACKAVYLTILDWLMNLYRSISTNSDTSLGGQGETKQ